ncbi:uncharacterized protein J3R85_017855 [Psidium guajava]|nr:uncharacterized protein J3R85_017855 [Psidium guajava]
MRRVQDDLLSDTLTAPGIYDEKNSSERNRLNRNHRCFPTFEPKIAATHCCYKITKKEKIPLTLRSIVPVSYIPLAAMAMFRIHQTIVLKTAT